MVSTRRNNRLSAKRNNRCSYSSANPCHRKKYMKSFQPSSAPNSEFVHFSPPVTYRIVGLSSVCVNRVIPSESSCSQFRLGKLHNTLYCLTNDAQQEECNSDKHTNVPHERPSTAGSQYLFTVVPRFLPRVRHEYHLLSLEFCLLTGIFHTSTAVPMLGSCRLAVNRP